MTSSIGMVFLQILREYPFLKAIKGILITDGVDLSIIVCYPLQRFSFEGTCLLSSVKLNLN